MTNSSSKPEQDIVRVKSLMLGDEFEMIVPSELAAILQPANAKPDGPGQPGRVIPTTPPKMPSLQESAARLGVLAIENAVDPDICLQIVEHARVQNRHRASLVNYDTKEEKYKESIVDDKVRDTYNISTLAIRESMLKGLFFHAITKHVEPFFNMRLDWWEEPQLLYYTDGGKYEPHVDADFWFKNEDGTEGWRKISDRDVSILLYLNEDFEGGALTFPDHHFKIKPKPGLLVAFPSGKDYRHGAEPTTSGERYVLVSWASAEGVAKVQPQPPKYPIIWMKELRK